jgi:hypothetical protein
MVMGGFLLIELMGNAKDVKARWRVMSRRLRPAILVRHGKIVYPRGLLSLRPLANPAKTSTTCVSLLAFSDRHLHHGACCWLCMLPF